MAQKIFEPFRKLPQQLHNLNLIQKLQGLTTVRSSESFGSLLASTYGCLESPSAIAYDEKLSILAVGSKNGSIRVYGTPGLVLDVRSCGPGIVHLSFLPEEGRLIVGTVDGALALLELNPRNGGWAECSRVQITNPEKEQICSMTLGHGVIYVGSSTGVLYQVAVNNGRLHLGDPILTALTSSMVLESVPVEKRNELGVDSAIVTLECQPEGSQLLVAYAGGCVAIVTPQPLPEANVLEQATTEAPAPTESGTAVNGTPTHMEATETSREEPNLHESADANVADTNDPAPVGDPITPRAPETPAKGEKRTTLKLKQITRSLKRLELGKTESDTQSPIPVPPPPLVSHVLLRDQPVEWATWRVHSIGSLSTEVTVAYGDGAFQVWPISASEGQDVSEAVIVSRRDPPSTPYGPLPCGAIKKIAQCPGAINNMLTVFSGGLPRAEFQDRHAVSVLQDSEHHVCFQFGSKVVDFILLPQKAVPSENGHTDTDVDQQHVPRPVSPKNASVLLVLTERELVAVDLEQPNWPTFASPYLNCLDVSPVTAVAHLTKVPSALLSRLRDFLWYDSNEITRSQWPITGGGNCSDGVDLSHNDCNDVVILGHENGWVTLLGIGRGDSLHRLGAFHTDILFNLTDSPKCHGTVEVETWPPFRRVGDCALTEPFCQQPTDPRLAITQLVPLVTADSITILVGGAAGQVSIWTAEGQQSPAASFEPDVSRILVNLLELESGKYTWDGLTALKPFEGVAQTAGQSGSAFRPRALVQFEPPAPVSAIALESNWNLLALGCSCGSALIDMLTNSVVWMNLLPPQSAEQQPARKGGRSMNVASVQTALAKGRRQVTAQLRQSFRRLKHLRTSASTSTPNEATLTDTADAAATTSSEPAAVGDQPDQNETKAEPAETSAPSEVTNESQPETDEKVAKEQPTEETEAVTAVVESVPPEPIRLSSEDPSAVRCLMFVDTYMISPVPATAQQPAIPSPRTPCLLVGTSSGRVLAYGLNWDETSGPVTVQLHKELQLQHRAPVIGLYVLDAHTKSPVTTSARIRTGAVIQEKASEPTVTAKEEDGKEATETEQPAETQSSTIQTPPDSHQLLLCSDEQVKLFQLPSLRALHKCKFVDRPRLHAHLGLNSSNSVGSETAAAKSEKPMATEKDDAESKPLTTSEVDTKSSQTMSQPNGKSIRAFGIQSFTRHAVANTDQTKTEWYAVVARQDGRMFILCLPYLRKVFKVKPTFNATMHCVPCVSSLSDANYVFWHSACQLAAYELCPNPHLLSPALVVPGSHAVPLATIVLPEWARPHPPPSTVEAEESKSTEEAGTTYGGALATDTAGVPLIDESGESVGQVINGATEMQAAVSTELVQPLPEKYNPTAALHAGDVTIDSIKEYLNGDSTVTIKTVETSTEKRTLVEGGHVVTTVRETECVDGQVTKDDILKYSTDGGSASPQPVVETS